jgi:hypothetical protein
VNKNVLQRLCFYAFQNASGIPDDYEAKKTLNVTSRTIRNWLAPENNDVERPIRVLREYLKSRCAHFGPESFHQTTFHEGMFYTRVQSLSTSQDVKTLLAIFYHEINYIEKIIIFARAPVEADANDYPIGFLICTKVRFYLMDETCMTAERRPRESEIQNIFQTFIANGLEEKIRFISGKAQNLNNLDVKDAVSKILKQQLDSFTLKNLVSFYPLISGSCFGLDPSEFFLDFGASTMKYVLSSIHDATVKYEDEDRIAIISSKVPRETMLKNIFKKFEESFGKNIENKGADNKILFKKLYLNTPVEFVIKTDNKVTVERRELRGFDKSFISD